jgi:hypothetical protein
MPSIGHYVEVTLKALAAQVNQVDSKNIIIVLVPRSQIDNHRAEHQAQEAVTDDLIAQALAEGRAPDISRSVPEVGGATLIERSRFLAERPLRIKGRSPDYDRNGFKGWIIEESLVPSS